LSWPLTTDKPYANHIRLSEIIYEMRIPMTRKKGVTNVSNGTSAGRAGTRSSTGSFEFINVKLSDEDAIFLDEQDATLPELAARLLSLADDGYGVGVKNLDLGQSICCTLTHPAGDDPTCTLAVSSFGGNVRDAVLSLLFKFDHKLAGEFPDRANAAIAAKPRFR
jgi:hypothetical protein